MPIGTINSQIFILLKWVLGLDKSIGKLILNKEWSDIFKGTKIMYVNVDGSVVRDHFCYMK